MLLYIFNYYIVILINVICDFQHVVAPIDAVEEPTIDEQEDGRVYKFVRTASKDFVSFNIILASTI